MGPDSTTAELVAAWKAGQEPAAAILVNRYFTRLVALIRSRWLPSLSPRLDPEDVVQSAYRSFFVRIRDGRLQETVNGDLWPLLARITVRKLIRQNRRQMSAGRNPAKEAYTVEQDPLRDLATHDPTPELSMQVLEEINAVLSQLSPTARQIAELALSGLDAVAIAKQIGCHDRTVRRILRQMRETVAYQAQAECLRVDLLDINAVLSLHDRQTSLRDQKLQPPTASLELYLLQSMVGQGAFSKVFRATEIASGQPLAIKFLRKPLWQDPHAAHGLQREFAVLSQLKHPYIITTLGWGKTRFGALYLALEWLDGDTLSTLSEQKRIQRSELFLTLQQVAEALDHAHAQGILHGDLKPSNVMRTSDQRTILMDFGMSRWFQWVDDVLPRGGTAGYLSPEQASPAFGDLTERTDVYGWGALAYALLTGRAPMQGNNLVESLAKVVSSNSPTKISGTDCAIPVAWEETILACLQKEPSLRPHSMRNILQRLHQ